MKKLLICLSVILSFSAIADSCDSVRNLLMSDEVRRARIDYFDSGAVGGSLLLGKFKNIDTSSISLSYIVIGDNKNILEASIILDGASSKECIFEMNFSGGQRLRNIAVRAGRTVVISGGIEGDEEEISILTVNPV